MVGIRGFGSYSFSNLGMMNACIEPIEEVPPSRPPSVDTMMYDSDNGEFLGIVNALGDGVKDHGFVCYISFTKPELANGNEL